MVIILVKQPICNDCKVEMVGPIYESRLDHFLEEIYYCPVCGSTTTGGLQT